MNAGTVVGEGVFKRGVIPKNMHSLYHDSFVSFAVDALLEELEHSTLQESDEYDSPASLSLDGHSKKESDLAETSKVPSAQDDTSSFSVTFYLLE